MPWVCAALRVLTIPGQTRGSEGTWLPVPHPPDGQAVALGTRSRPSTTASLCSLGGTWPRGQPRPPIRARNCQQTPPQKLLAPLPEAALPPPPTLGARGPHEGPCPLAAGGCPEGPQGASIGAQSYLGPVNVKPSYLGLISRQGLDLSFVGSPPGSLGDHCDC